MGNRNRQKVVCKCDLLKHLGVVWLVFVPSVSVSLLVCAIQIGLVQGSNIQQQEK